MRIYNKESYFFETMSLKQNPKDCQKPYTLWLEAFQTKIRLWLNRWKQRPLFKSNGPTLFTDYSHVKSPVTHLNHWINRNSSTQIRTAPDKSILVILHPSSNDRLDILDAVLVFNLRPFNHSIVHVAPSTWHICILRRD